MYRDLAPKPRTEPCPPPQKKRQRALTPEDMASLREEMLEVLDDHRCQFTREEIQYMRDFVEIYKETRSIVIKTIIGLFFLGILILTILGYSHGMLSIKR